MTELLHTLQLIQLSLEYIPSVYPAPVPLGDMREQSATTKPQSTGEEQPEQRVRILLVEDNRDALAILSLLLERRGYSVLKAPDCRTAVSIGRINDFDILLCDIGLPDGSGMEVLRELKKTKDFPSIAVTAWTTSRDIEEQIDAGFDLHVSKPYMPEDLLTAVKKLLSPSDR